MNETHLSCQNEVCVIEDGADGLNGNWADRESLGELACRIQNP